MLGIILELLDLAASQILTSIVEDCNMATCFAFISDESTDVGIKEQIAMCVRFVDGRNRHTVLEEFFSFVHADTGTLIEKFLETLERTGKLVHKMRAQGYDGASVVGGHINGVQAWIRRVTPKHSISTAVHMSSN